MKTVIDRIARRKPFFKARLDALTALAFFATVLALCWLCCVCSGSRRVRNKDRPFRRDAIYEAGAGLPNPGSGSY